MKAAIRDELKRRAVLQDGFLKTYLKSLVDTFYLHAEAIGGGARDVFNANQHAERNGLPYWFENNLTFLIEKARVQLNWRGRLEDKAADLRLAVRITQWMVLHTQFSPDQIIASAMKTGDALKADLFANRLIQSGVLPPDQVRDWNGGSQVIPRLVGWFHREILSLLPER